MDAEDGRGQEQGRRAGALGRGCAVQDVARGERADAGDHRHPSRRSDGDLHDASLLSPVEVDADACRSEDRDAVDATVVEALDDAPEGRLVDRGIGQRREWEGAQSPDGLRGGVTSCPEHHGADVRAA